MFGCLRIISKGQVATMLAGLGAGVGALIGMAIPPGEKWTAVPNALGQVDHGGRAAVRIPVGGGKSKARVSSAWDGLAEEDGMRRVFVSEPKR